MIPVGSLTPDYEISEEVSTSRTYQLSEDRIQGYVTDALALKQAIYKVLNTEKYEYPIYSFNYGIELENLIGKASTYVKIELMRRIKECLEQDERISSVDNFEYSISGDELLCTFDVKSIYGDIQLSKEVNY